MSLRGIVLGLGLAFVALLWWRVLRRRSRATGTVTRRPPREHEPGMSTEVTFEVDGREFRFSPSVVTNFDVGKLTVGSKVAVAYDPNDPASADLAEPWRLYSGPVIATLLYLVALYYLFVA
jgi:hypothetical protein